MPKTHYLYEGKSDVRAVVKNGIRLWHEEAESRSKHQLSDLWKAAEKAFPAGSKSTAEMCALLIIGDSLIPSAWNADGPFPYKFLFASAIYFIEACRTIESEEPERAWPTLVQAYYYLGMNSSEMTSHESASKSATQRHEVASAGIRGVITEILSTLKDDASIRNASDARKKVIEIIRLNRRYQEILDEYDKKIPVKTKKEKDYTSLDRLLVRMEAWHSSRSPYPDVSSAFEPFKRKNRHKDNDEDPDACCN